jgi:PAS domain S-box-containing protein
MDPSATDRPVDFPAEIDRLRERISRFRASDVAPAESVLAELEVAYEELRVAEEEVRTQQEEIARLAESSQLARWQQERMLEMVPVPMLTTDREGLVRSANAAAAGLLGVPLPHLLGKPLAMYVAMEHRPDVRGELRRLVGGGRWSRVLTVVDRVGSPVLVEASVTADAAPEGLLTWMFLAADAGPVRRPPGRLSLAEALVRMATMPLSGSDVDQLLPRCARLCQDVLGDDVSLTVTAGSPTAPRALASTTRIAQAIDGAQLAHEEGPCVTAFEERRTVVTTDVCADPRWPALGADPRCREAGGAIAVALQIGDELLGALNVYGEVGDPVDAQLVEQAELLSAGVAAVFHEVATRRELAATAIDLERALTSRSTIDQAKGIVMADRGCSAEEAFEHLVQLSSTRHVKLREVARMIVDQRTSGRRERLP